MSQGVLLFAFNNKAVNYVEQAEFCCKKIRKHLQLPVTIVTADEVPNNCLLYTSPSPRDSCASRMPSSA